LKIGGILVTKSIIKGKPGEMQMKKRAKNKKIRSESTQEKIQKTVDGEVKEKPFDFGGLPERNLKKNLGC
jgi:hypothetical protein